MSKKLYEEDNVRDIADAIREQNGTENSYTVAQMSAAVRAIKTQPDLETLNATENGNYLPSAGKDGFSSVSVDVESEEAIVQPLTVTQNGIYTAPSGVDGYSPVTVDVSGGTVVVTDTIEQGGFDNNGINTANAARLRSKNFIPVTPGQDIFIYLLPSSARNISSTSWQIAINTYSTDDYTAPRLTFIGWNYYSVLQFTVPTDAHYIRIMIGINGGNSTINASDVSGVYVVYRT